jgi:cysteine desulfurase/selenocysteine lyase
MGGRTMNREIRAQFPVTQEYVYVNSAGASPQPLVVEQAARSYLNLRNREAPDDVDRLLQKMEEVRGLIADFIGAKPNEIAFTMCTGDGVNLVANALDLGPGDNIVLDDLDYPTNLLVWWDHQQRKGLEIRLIRSEDGTVPLESFEGAVDENTRVISVSRVSHQNGYNHDMRGLADLAHAHGAYLFDDAIQAVGAIQVNVRELGIDFLSCGLYKWLLGPRGLAFVYVREELLDRIRPTRQGWMQLEDGFYDLEHRKIFTSARKFEYGTPNFLGVYQLGAALEYMNEIGKDKIEQQVLSLSSQLYNGLSEKGLRLFTPPGTRSGIVSFLA